MTLRDIEEGQTAQIVRVRGSGPFRRRLMEMGFVPGETVFVQRYAPLRDPVEFVIKHYHVSLRREDAAFVDVVLPSAEGDGAAFTGRMGQRRRRRGWHTK
ncbi:MAG: ferrous iron transport protein A [Deltaproteobacteria bacterium]|nr:ferrous iron transport protein A [Candidatus Zymogenaceae bacterium]